MLIAAAGSAGLLATGVWLHRRDGHVQAALAMVGTAIAGLWLTLVAASILYQLVAMTVALALAVGIGVLATAIAVRWDSRTVAALGIGEPSSLPRSVALSPPAGLPSSPSPVPRQVPYSSGADGPGWPWVLRPS